MKLSDVHSADCFLLNDCIFHATGMNYSKNDGTLTLAINESYLNVALDNDHIVGIITTNELKEKVPKKYGCLICDDPRAEFYRIHNLCYESYRRKTDVQTVVGNNCSISKTADIDKKNIIIGDNVIIDNNVSVIGPAMIGSNTIIHNGCTIGGEGFQFPRNLEGKPMKAAHFGNVHICEGVEIFENTNIAKGVFFGETTWIGKNTKIDTLCHIAHSVRIGEDTLIAAKAMIGGAAHIGNRVWIGPMAAVSNMISVGDDARILIGSVVTKNVAPGMVVSGNFAIPHDINIAHIKDMLVN